MTPATRPIEHVRKFWELNPVAAAAIPYPLGTPEYFQCSDRLREKNEDLEFSYQLHEYRQFTGRHILDVGYGNGYVLSKYAQEGAKIQGVDPIRTAVNLGSQRFALLGLDGHFSLGNAEELPFREETFDCVCSMVPCITHLPQRKRWKKVSEC